MRVEDSGEKEFNYFSLTLSLLKLSVLANEGTMYGFPRIISLLSKLFSSALNIMLWCEAWAFLMTFHAASLYLSPWVLLIPLSCLGNSSVFVSLSFLLFIEIHQKVLHEEQMEFQAFSEGSKLLFLLYIELVFLSFRVSYVRTEDELKNLIEISEGRDDSRVKKKRMHPVLHHLSASRQRCS